ncbi:hypothetical protein AB0D38_18670, partial [Streptomyces sp. NPDC048279]|uniref:hypothetical protein n=1 Tax=Streptomyces sp. NPDC048279 TaxID=3154714 RepID=UPI003413497F
MTGTDVRNDAEDTGPSGYAAARLRLLTEGARSGPSRRTALAELTDDWLTGLFAAATEGITGGGSTGPTRRRSSVRRSRCGRRTRTSSSSV